MHNFFQTHPYSTTVGILIERVTDAGNSTINWALVLEICDVLCETDDGPRDAIRAIRKRLTSSAGKENICIWYTLVLLETCIKNCGKRFKIQIANRDFLNDLIKILSPKYNPPIQLQTKVLYMVKFWVDSSWDIPGRRDLEKVYAALCRKGVQFPSKYEYMMIQSSNLNPSSSKQSERNILLEGYNEQLKQSQDYSSCEHQLALPTNQTSTNLNLRQLSRVKTQNCQIISPSELNQSAIENSRQLQIVAVNNTPVQWETGTRLLQGRSHSNRPGSADEKQTDHHHHCLDQTCVEADGTVHRLSNAQKERVAKDLSVVQINLHILNDMLTELQPDKINSDDLELLQELNETCHAMQQRVAEFLANVVDDTVTLSLLQLNDELNSAFERYNRFERYRIQSLKSNAIKDSLRDTENSMTLTKPALTNSQHEEPATVKTKVSNEDNYDDELLEAIAKQTHSNSAIICSDIVNTHNGTFQPAATVHKDSLLKDKSTFCRQQTMSENVAALEFLQLDGAFANSSNKQNIQYPSNACILDTIKPSPVKIQPTTTKNKPALKKDSSLEQSLLSFETV